MTEPNYTLQFADESEPRKKPPLNYKLEFEPEGEAASVINRITEGVKRGFSNSEGTFYNKLANAFMVYRGGIEAGSPEEKRNKIDNAIIDGLQSAEGWARQQADTFFTSQKPAQGGVLDTAAEMAGAFPLQAGTAIAEFSAGGPAALAADAALSSADQGPGTAAIEAAKAYGGGAMVQALPGVPQTIRPLADVAAGAAQVQAGGGGLTEQAINAGLAGVGYRRANPKKLRNVTTKAGNINLAYLDTAENIKGALQIVSKEEGDFETARRGVRTHEATLDAANAIGMNADELLKRRGGQAFNAEEAVRARQLLVGNGEDLVSRAQKIAEGGASDEEKTRFLQSYVRHVAIQEQVSGMTAEAGRALESFKIKATADRGRAEAIKTILRDYAGNSSAEDLAAMIASIDTPEGLAKFTRKAFKATTGDKLLEVWMNSLLSGPQTHVVNMTSNGLVALYTAGPETLMAAGYGAIRGGEDRILFRESLAKINGMKRGVGVGLRLAAQAFDEEDVQVGLSKVDVPRRRALQGALGKLVRTPGRALDAEDVFFKVVNYSGELEALATRQAAKEGLTGQEMANRVAELLNDPPEAMAGSAWKVAQVNTFTNDLGRFGQWLQGGVAQHKSLRVIMPFVRTPLNILNFGAKRIPPIALAMPSTWKDLKAGGIQRDQALARLTLGSLVGGSVALMQSEGSITGGGPAEKNEREALYRTGWQPYSLKIGDKYYSYARLEPIGTLLGTWADFAETRELMKTAEADEVAAKISFAASRNFINKSYMQGLSNLIEAMQDPTRYGEKYIGNLLGSMVPTGVSQYANVEDAYLRDAQSIMDSVKNRIPGAKETLEKRLNLWGQPIKREGGVGPDLLSPIYQSTAKDDPVSKEMLSIRYFPAMPPRQIGGVDLDQKQYWEYVKLAGEPAKETLNLIVTGNKLGTLSLAEMGYNKPWDRMNTATKEAVMRRVIEDYRRGASQMMLSKYPALIEESIKKGIDPFTGAQ